MRTLLTVFIFSTILIIDSGKTAEFSSNIEINDGLDLYDRSPETRQLLGNVTYLKVYLDKRINDINYEYSGQELPSHVLIHKEELRISSNNIVRITDILRRLFSGDKITFDIELYVKMMTESIQINPHNPVLKSNKSYRDFIELFGYDCTTENVISKLSEKYIDFNFGTHLTTLNTQVEKLLIRDLSGAIFKSSVFDQAQILEKSALETQLIIDSLKAKIEVLEQSMTVMPITTNENSYNTEIMHKLQIVRQKYLIQQRIKEKYIQKIKAISCLYELQLYIKKYISITDFNYNTELGALILKDVFESR